MTFKELDEWVKFPKRRILFVYQSQLEGNNSNNNSNSDNNSLSVLVSNTVADVKTYITESEWFTG